jgi:hypothetical protein
MGRYHQELLSRSRVMWKQRQVRENLRVMEENKQPKGLEA